MSSFATVGRETVEITNRGWYEAPSGSRVSVAEAIERATRDTVLYRPGDFDRLAPRDAQDGARMVIEVTSETTAESARRLVEREREPHVAALNFASAKNPGGGFLGGARAQEEDLARCSALYACQLKQPDYYAGNRAAGTLLYTDHLIYSPAVPFFRDERLELLETPFLVSILTSPAPNAGEARRRGEGGGVRDTLRRRAEHVLRVAAHHGHRTLVLGAWGCGVFRNDPSMVSEVFADLLAQPPLASAFGRVVFAIYDRSPAQATLRAFEARFAPSRGGVGVR